jgi:hypothetical protein
MYYYVDYYVNNIKIFSFLVLYVVFVFGGHAKGLLVIFTPSSIFFSFRKYAIFSLLQAWLITGFQYDCSVSVILIGLSLHFFLFFRLRILFINFHGSVICLLSILPLNHLIRLRCIEFSLLLGCLILANLNLSFLLLSQLASINITLAGGTFFSKF